MCFMDFGVFFVVPLWGKTVLLTTVIVLERLQTSIEFGSLFGMGTITLLESVLKALRWLFTRIPGFCGQVILFDGQFGR